MDDDEEGGTLIDVPRLFVDEAFMKYKTSKIKNAGNNKFLKYDHQHY